MTEFVSLLLGMLIGSCFGIAILCCVQINRICRYEREIRRLKNKLKKKNEEADGINRSGKSISSFGG